MNRFQTKLFCLLILAAATPSTLQAADPADPDQSVPFALVLQDGSTATAIFLPTADGRKYLVYSTGTSTIAFWTMQRNGTTPQPTPLPAPPLTPPEALTKLALITVTASEPATIPKDVQAKLTAGDSTYSAFTVTQVADKDTSAIALQWIGRSAGKTYPYTFLAAADGKILWQGPTPIGVADFLAIFNQTKQQKQSADKCSGGKCPCRNDAE